MMQLSFMSGVALALILALTASIAVLVLSPVTGTSLVLRLLISVLGFLYLVWLIRGSRMRSGRITALAFWVVLSVGNWFLAPTLSMYLLIHIAAIWLVRSLAVYSGVLPALLDLGLTATSAAAATWALSRSGSVFLATWCFFLLQALFVAIPTSLRHKKRACAPYDDCNDETFERARRRADAALEQLFSRTDA